MAVERISSTGNRLAALVVGNQEAVRAMSVAYWLVIVGGVVLYLVVGLTVE